MRICMNTLLAGPNAVREVGWIGDVPTAEGRQLLDGGFAYLVDANGNRVEEAVPEDKKPAPRK